ncbi:nucleotidyltransferase family protein [Natroniella sulfidigena]|uniref:nucleotidyltransferase family protein n=1 Tax=Natroniella sulfidigena TaxID=723921 RepID=UPI00200A7D0F|nr:nucleotidyltransferase family protein [Natroniella sulfidigena]MCK8817037.1 nucleotidyltransferase family protein [Natroniella sulfidigena]
MGLDAIVLAGAVNDGKLAEVSEQDYEALIKINDQPMVDYVVNTLQQVELIDRIILVGPAELAQGNLDLEGNVELVISGQNTLLENIKLGLSQTDKPYSLVLSSDIPLITVEAIEAFLAKCEADRAVAYYPIIPQEFNQLLFSDTNRTCFKLVDGSFTGGNIFLLNGPIILRLEKLLAKILAWRKKPWKLAYLLGFKFIVKLLTGRLSIELIEEEVYKLTGYQAKAVIVDYPEIGFDIDRPKQLMLAREFYQDSSSNIN